MNFDISAMKLRAKSLVKQCGMTPALIEAMFMGVESDCCYVWIFEYTEWVNRRLYHIGCYNVAFDIFACGK